MTTIRLLVTAFATVLVASWLCAAEPALKTPKIEFENATGDDGKKVVLGPKSTKSFLETVKAQTSDFDPEFLEKSEPMGFFTVGKQTYEFHVDLIVQEIEGKPPRIWSSKFSKGLTKRMLEEGEGWKAFLAE